MTTRLFVTILCLVGPLLFGSCARSVPSSVRAWRDSLASHTTPDRLKLRYLDVGPRDGEAIVLLHGLPTNSSLYREVIPGLVEHGYRVIAPDLVGYGASSKPSAPSAYALPRQGERLESLLQALELPRVSLVVHDLGGLVGWELLDRAPQRIARILVLNTTAYHQGFRPPVEMRLLAGAMGPMMAAMMSSDTLGRTLMGDFLRENTGSKGAASSEIVDSVWWSMREGSSVPMRAMATSFSATAERFSRYQRALRAFAGPAAILWGARDSVLSFERIGTQFAEDLRIPSERQGVLPKAGHFLMLDAPTEVTRAILELMQEPAAESGIALSREAPKRVHAFSSPPPGPSASTAAELRSYPFEDGERELAGETRLRFVWGELPGYAAGLDASLGYASSLRYRTALYPLGLGYAGHGSLVTFSAGGEVHRDLGDKARLALPAALSVALQLGPVRALAWGHVAWTQDRTWSWQSAVGLRLGRSTPYFPNAVQGSGPYLAATASGEGDDARFGIALGMELGDGR